jgi:hypothetical protein
MNGTMQNQKPVEILFVGNSFTHGFMPPAQSFNSEEIVDANGTNYGGVPGIFKRLAGERGQNFHVTILASCGETLEGHFEKRSEVIAGRRWDRVVLQELSTRPLPTYHRGEPARYRAGAEKLAGLIRGSNPSAKIFLYETWASPCSVREQGYEPQDGLRHMQRHLRESISSLCESLGLSGVVRVGEAFLKAVEGGIAAREPREEELAGKISLWAGDHRHASAYGSYLAAAVFCAQFASSGQKLPGAESAEVIQALGLDPSVAERLSRIAFEVGHAAEDSGRVLSKE